MKSQMDKQVKLERAIFFLACAFLLLLVVNLSMGATQPQCTWSLYKGTSKAGSASATTCDAAYAACMKQATATNMTCKTPVGSLITVPDPPPLIAHLSWAWSADVPAPFDLTGYRIQYGQAFDGAVCQQTGLTQSISIGNVAAYDLTQNLTAGTWCFAIRAVTPAGEGALSNAVVKTF